MVYLRDFGLSLLCIFIFNFESSAQKADALLTDKVNFNFEYGNYYVTRFGELNNVKNLYLPNSISSIRKQSYEGYEPEIALDNPLKHLAFYIDLVGKVKLSDSTSLTVNLVTEHRGVSYGVYNVNNIALIPQFTFKLNETVNFLNKKLTFHGHFGNTREAKIHEGLLIYNIDVQGNDFNIRYKKLNFNIFHIGDLNQGIGLNIGDAVDYILSLDRLKLKENWYTDIRVGAYHEVSNTRYQGIKLSSGFYNKKNMRLYAQGAYSLGLTSSLNLNQTNFSYLIGGTKAISKNRFKLKSKLEYRFYGWRFNKGFRNLKPSYRESRIISSSYGGSIGNTVYPIYAYNRPFSQWAVYTEYGTPFNFSNISSIIFTTDFSYRFFKALSIDVSLDVNYISRKTIEDFTYIFYTSKLVWDFSKGQSFSLLVTNKGMNLDVNYPTFYFHKRIQYGFSFIRKLSL